MRRHRLRERGEREASSWVRQGMRVRVTGNSNNHSYDIGETYIVSLIDPDNGAIRARDLTSGKVGNWLVASDLEPVATIGWDWLKTRLPERDVSLLAAFDGLTRLELKEAVKASLVSKVPELKRAILDALKEAG